MPLAIHRRYRPRIFGDLVGQDHVVEILRSAARQNRIAHAYLLYGPRGTGKTTAARLIAKIANCETRAADALFREQGEPCNRCRPCTEIDAGHALDVVEIDAASNRGIDEIRSLKESVKLSPTSYRTKVFIVDEVHQLTKEAWNALLKTLEEPPLHAIFVLATTEYEKVPATVLSRTQRFHFRRLSVPEIAAKLERIARAEQIRVTTGALELIAASAEGSFRDAESLLEQVASLEAEVTEHAVEQIVGRVGVRRVSELATLVLAGKLAESLDLVAHLHADGGNVVDLTKELIHYLRRAMTLAFDPKVEELFRRELTDRELEGLRAAATRVDAKRHVPLLRALIRAWSEMRYSPFATVPLEAVFVEHLGEENRAR